MFWSYRGSAVVLLCVFWAAPTRGDRVQFFVDPAPPILALVADDPSSIGELAVPIFHSDMGSTPVLINGHDHKVVEAFHDVPGMGRPLTSADIVASTFTRLTFQRPDGSSASLGTSFVRSPSYRLAPDVLRFIPTDNVQGTVFTREAMTRYRTVVLGGHVDSMDTRETNVTINTTYTDPLVGTTTAVVSAQVEFLQNASLATISPFPENDRFRMLTGSSSFVDETIYDTDLIRYEDINGVIKTIELTNATPKGQHLLAAPDEIGSWLELIKRPGDTVNPGSPSMRVDILDKHGLTFGLQGFLLDTMDPAADSLSVWLEVPNVPDMITSGSQFAIDYRITAVAIPEPGSLVLTVVGGLFVAAAFARRRARTRRP